MVNAMTKRHPFRLEGRVAIVTGARHRRRN